MGCAICEETICDVCWYKGYDKHRNNDTAWILLCKISIIGSLALVLDTKKIRGGWQNIIAVHA